MRTQQVSQAASDRDFGEFCDAVFDAAVERGLRHQERLARQIRLALRVLTPLAVLGTGTLFVWLDGRALHEAGPWAMHLYALDATLIGLVMGLFPAWRRRRHLPHGPRANATLPTGRRRLG